MEYPQPSPEEPRESISTLSFPERPAYLLIFGFLGLTAVLVVVVFFLIPEEGGIAELVLVLTGLTAIGLLGATMVKTLVVHLEADADNGLTVSVGHLITRRIPWAAITSVEEAPRGGSIDVGWKMMGGGRVGYLAGAETILVKISPEFRKAARAGEVRLEGSSRLAEWYYISAPDSGRIASQLETFRRAAA